MAVSVNQILANTLGLADPLGRIADDGRVGFNGRVNINGRPIRFAPNFDSIDDYGVLTNRAINPDGDIDVEFYSPTILNATLQTIISQCISTTFTAIEFRVLVNASNSLNFIVGGSSADILSVAEGFSAGERFRVRLQGTTLQVWKGALNGSPVKTMSFTRGAAREPSAQTVVGASTNGSAGSFFRFFQGFQYNIKINGVLWAMDRRNQAIQPSTPVGNNMTLSNVAADRWQEVRQ